MAGEAKRILIADDEYAARNQIREVIESFEGLELVAELNSGEAAVSAICELEPDLVFLDIDMPGIDGFGVAEATKHINYQLVFLTAHHKYALRAFDTQAIDYLLKPARPALIEKCLAKILRQEILSLEQKTTEQTSISLVLTDSGTSKIVDSDHLVFIEGLGRYRRLHLSEEGAAIHHSETLLSDTTLDDFSQRLPEPFFMRAHRSYLVNLSMITSITTTGRRCELSLKGVLDPIPVARARAQTLRETLERSRK